MRPSLQHSIASSLTSTACSTQRQVLALEGALADLPYIAPAPAQQPKRPDTPEGGGEGEDRVAAGSSTGRIDETRVCETSTLTYLCRT